MQKGWNLQSETWKKLHPLISRLDWKRVVLHADHGNTVPNRSGVYMICGKTPFIVEEPFANFYNVLYVGLSKKSIQNRFLAHCNTPDVNIKQAKQLYKFVGNKISFYFATAPDSEVDNIEDRLIECFGPPSNRKSGNKNVIKANLCGPQPAG